MNYSAFSRVSCICLIVCFIVSTFANNAFGVWGIGDVVFDPTNWTENVTQVLQTLEVIANQIQDLQALVVFPIVSIAQDLSRLTTLINRLKSLMPFDESRVDHLFATSYGAAPCTESALNGWLNEVQSLVRDAHHAAQLAQTLINDIFELIECITGIIDQVLQIAGSVAGLQALGQIQSVVVHQQARIMAMMGGFQSAMSTTQMYQMTYSKALTCIGQGRLRNISRDNPYNLQLGTR